MAGNLSLIEQVKNVTVTVDDIQSVVDATADLPEDRRSLETSVVQLMKLFPGDQNHFKRMAISFRMMAFSNLIKDSDKFGISFIRRADGSVSVTDAVLAAIAETPFVERGDELSFEPTELFRRAKEFEAQDVLR